jgi:hypothetical protein
MQRGEKMRLKTTRKPPEQNDPEDEQRGKEKMMIEQRVELV